MITEQNKWVVIEAYLAGQLDEPGRQEVAQKMTDDAQFQADVLMQYALNQHLEQEQAEQDSALVDKILQEESARKSVGRFTGSSPAVVAETMDTGRCRGAIDRVVLVWLHTLVETNGHSYQYCLRTTRPGPGWNLWFWSDHYLSGRVLAGWLNPE